MTFRRDGSHGARVAAVAAIGAALAGVAVAITLALGEEDSDGRSDRAVERAEPSRVGAAERAAPPAPKAPAPRAPAPRAPAFKPVRYRDSRALGEPHAGSLVRGTRLPARGAHFTTWDPILRRSPGRHWRRYGTDELVRMVVAVARRYAAAEPSARPMMVGDLSRPRGGDFGPQYGFIGHSTHQNGLDVDVYYPRLDRRRKVPKTVAQVDRRRSQRLVHLFVAAGAQTVLVGPNVGLSGPPEVVKPFPNHDNHLHVRIANPS